jgi:hypothetical protein
MGLLDAFRALKRVMTGEIIQQIDTTANGGQTRMSLRLKRDKSSDEYYVVLAGLSGGNYQYFAFTRDEFGDFSKAVQTIDDSLTLGRPQSAT